MADNRMFIREKTTGKVFFIAKFYPSQGWYSADDIGPELDKFLHSAGNEAILKRDRGSLIGPTTFEIVYESAEKNSGATEIEFPIN